MTQISGKDVFTSAYAAKAPWDINGPQPAFVEIVGRIKGSVLDAGCGTGDLSIFLAQRGHKVTGIDFIEEPIRRAKAKAAAQGVTVTFLVMDALALDALPEVFDQALDCGLFHVSDDAQRLRYAAGLASVVKPGGRLFLMCFSDAEPAGVGPRRVSRAELETAFAKDWTMESIVPTQFQVIPEFQPNFTPGGPKSWFVTVVRK